jgi:hypothetical protein
MITFLTVMIAGQERGLTGRLPFPWTAVDSSPANNEGEEALESDKTSRLAEVQL